VTVCLQCLQCFGTGCFDGWKDGRMEYNYEPSYYVISAPCFCSSVVQGDHKVSVHLTITIQKVTSNVQSVLRQSPDIY
jgi:hypothetical protein